MASRDESAHTSTDQPSQLTQTQTKRFVKLTPKAQEQFEKSVCEKRKAIDASWSEVFPLTFMSPEITCDRQTILDTIRDIEEKFATYRRNTDTFISFVEGVRSEEGEQMKAESVETFKNHQTIVNRRVQELTELLSSLTKRHPALSISSSTLSKAAAARAKAEAAKARLVFVEKEAKLKQQKLAIETELDVVAAQKDAASALAEADALESCASCRYSDHSLASLSVENKHSRTLNYIQEVQSQNLTPVMQSQSDVHEKNVTLNPEAIPFVSHSQPSADLFLVSEITKLLLKKDLLVASLTVFNDSPENYQSWKYSFKSKMSELSVSPMEEMDLLVKWIGSTSRQQVLTLRSAYFSDPSRGVAEIWKRLDERFGSPVQIESSLKQKLSNFPKLNSKNTKRLYELHDILVEIAAIKRDDKYSSVLAYFDSSVGVNPIVSKLPSSLQDKWTSHASRYIEDHNVIYPPFEHFCKFIGRESSLRNNPNFNYDVHPVSLRYHKTNIHTHKTNYYEKNVQCPTHKYNAALCPLHQTNHSINKCKRFKSKPLEARRRFLLFNNLCFKCCQPGHNYRECVACIKCEDCGSNKHVSAMHLNITNKTPLATPSSDETYTKETITSACTQLCGSNFTGKSCSKIVPLWISHESCPGFKLKVYSLIDDQSNRSLINPELLDRFPDIDFPTVSYSLTSCSGVTETLGRRASGFVIKNLDESVSHNLPVLMECDKIPQDKHEIPTPDVVYHHPHLNDLTYVISPVDPDCEILLLLGRDIVEVHHVHDQRIVPKGSPYAQKLSLGWVVIGETCLSGAHCPEPNVSSLKTHVLGNGRPSLMAPCPYQLMVKNENKDGHYSDIFEIGIDSEKSGMSVEDDQFICLMEAEFKPDVKHMWTAPLPFKCPRPRLPNNRNQAWKRAQILHTSLRKNATKKEHMFQFMQGILQSGHAEIAPRLNPGEECWYLPLFGVYHPKKKDKIRGVFDSSAEFEGISLNKVLMKGPDLTNSLLGVLLRFRKGVVAVSCDIEQMFYCFAVRENHRNFLRFLWYKNNQFSERLVEYRMCKHVFGNKPSPAVANFGLRKIVQHSEEDVRTFVTNNFYVDDGLIACDDAEEAVTLIRKTQNALREAGGVRLHKIVSNNQCVLEAFDREDVAKDVSNIDLKFEDPPLQRSLGIYWDLHIDSFTFRVETGSKPYTRRGVLSTINSLYDPLGFAAPVTIKGKVMLRDMMSTTTNWDEPLPEQFKSEWDVWESSLKDLDSVRVPRAYCSIPVKETSNSELFVYCDASEKAIAVVSYLRITDQEGNPNIAFVLGKSKIAPKQGHTIPRLELCASVLAVQVAEIVTQELSISPGDVKYFTDSKVVLGYLCNTTRRFYVYVSNRVQRILKFSKPSQWHFVSTSENPADHGTRYLPPILLGESSWITGPQHLTLYDPNTSQEFNLVEPDEDREIRPDVGVMKTDITSNLPSFSSRIQRFSQFKKLIQVVAFLKHIAKSFQRQENELCYGWHHCTSYKNCDSLTDARTFLIKSVQQQWFSKEINSLKTGKPIQCGSSLRFLSPVLDKDGLICVGGRLQNAELPILVKHPILVPGKHHLAMLIVRHYHETVSHQGRHLTEGAIREAGFWITGGKRLVSKIIYKCVTCQRFRGKLTTQKMANLPADRIRPGPPFTSVGVDCFGPWHVVVRKTRGGQANSKRWAVMFTCLCSRAVHIEVIEDMSTSSFINALRRFISIRGKVELFRSDRGTNFTGATEKLGINVESAEIKGYLLDAGAKWIFNPPHASHMGGAWERMIGITRRILDTLLIDASRGTLTHEVLTTFLAEVTAIINSRPLAPVSSDPNQPFPLTPSLLLTQKGNGIVGVDIPVDLRNIHGAQWKRVQILAEMFWKRWRNEFLHILQERRKWTNDQKDLKQSDVVLIKDKQTTRASWHMGIVSRVFPSDDGKIRTVEVRTVGPDGKIAHYTRPVHELVLLIDV